MKDIDPPAFVGASLNNEEDVMLELDGVRPLKMGVSPLASACVQALLHY